MAHAVVMKVKFRKGQTPEDGQRMLEDVVIPTTKSLAGFENGTWLYDGKGNGLAVIVLLRVKMPSPLRRQSSRRRLHRHLKVVSIELHEVGGQA